MAGGIPFLFYLRTLAPTVYGLDSAELTTGSWALGIVHAPGSPLYLLLGHLFTWLPMGDVGYRLNLMSACASTLTLVFMGEVIYLLTEKRLLSLTAVWFLAFSYYVWVPALAAELYALQGTFVAGLLWLVLRWQKERQPWQLYLLTFGLGLGLGVHLSLVLLVPGFSVIVLATLPKPWREWRLLATAVATGCLGLTVFLYLPVRYMSDTPLNYAKLWHVDLTTLQGFWWMVTGKMFGSLFFSVPTALLPTELRLYVFRLWSNFMGFGCLLGLVGLLGDLRQRPFLHLGLALMFVAHLLFYITYRIGDKEVMFLPTYLIWGIWVALGTATAVRWLSAFTTTPLESWGTAVLFLFALSNLVLNFTYVDLSQDWSARRLGEAIFAELEPNAVYIGTWKDVPILEYLQIVEEQRPDVVLVNVFFTPPEQIEQILSNRVQTQQPAYLYDKAVVHPERFAFTYKVQCECYAVTAVSTP